MRRLTLTLALLGALAAPAAAQAAAPPTAPTATVDASMAGMLLIADLPGPTLDAASARLLSQQHLGGVVLFGRNITGGRQLKALVTALHQRKALITIDQEGGTVRRLKPQGPAPSAQQVGRLSTDAITALMKAAGHDLHLTGIDVDLAPDADIDRPGSFIGSRSYGSDWRKVRDDVAAAVTGLQAGGTLATAKHFPGLGGLRTTTDAKAGTAPRVTGPQLQPFAAAAKAGVALVMVGHGTYPGLGNGPASLQHQAYDLLRGPSVGFTGVAITDDLAAGALAKVPVTVAAVNAIRAGADLVIVTGGPARAQAVIAALQKAVRSGVIPASRFRQAVARVAVLRQECHLT